MEVTLQVSSFVEPAFTPRCSNALFLQMKLKLPTFYLFIN